jgi:hypothetical protein
MVIAGLKGYVEDIPSLPLSTYFIKGIHFSVVGPRPFVIPGGDDFSLTDDNRPNGRIWGCTSQPFPGLAQGHSHEFFVCLIQWAFNHSDDYRR